MKNTILVISLFFISSRIFPQGSYCSRNTAQEVNNETYLLKRIKNTDLAELISEINRKLYNHYYQLQEKNKEYLEEKYANLDCLVQPGFCTVFSIEAFGFFQDGVFDNFNLSKTILIDISTGKLQGVDIDETLKYLKENYTNKNQNLFDTSIANPSRYTDEYISTKIKEYLKNSGDHGLLELRYKLFNSSDEIGHVINVLNINNKIYYVDNNYLTNYIAMILPSHNSNLDKLFAVYLMHID